MTRDTLSTLITALSPAAVLAVALAFLLPNTLTETSADSQASALDRQAVREIVHEGIAEAGLTGAALDGRMEQAIIAFIKSRASEPGIPAPQEKARPTPQANVDVEPIDSATEPVAGSPGARYQLIVYSDYECPFCKRFDPRLKTVIERYGERLAVTLRDYPLPFHGETAIREAIAAQCAFELGSDAAFWPFSHGLFEHTGSNAQGLTEGGQLDLAVEVGLERAAFKDCLESPGEIRAGIEADRASGTAAGVRGTPTSVLLDTRTGKAAVLRGAQPLSAVTSALDGLLSESSAGASK